MLLLQYVWLKTYLPIFPMPALPSMWNQKYKEILCYVM